MSVENKKVVPAGSVTETEQASYIEEISVTIARIHELIKQADNDIKRRDEYLDSIRERQGTRKQS